MRFENDFHQYEQEKKRDDYDNIFFKKMFI